MLSVRNFIFNTRSFHESEIMDRKAGTQRLWILSLVLMSPIIWQPPFFACIQWSQLYPYFVYRQANCLKLLLTHSSTTRWLLYQLHLQLFYASSLLTPAVLLSLYVFFWLYYSSSSRSRTLFCSDTCFKFYPRSCKREFDASIWLLCTIDEWHGHDRMSGYTRVMQSASLSYWCQ